MLIFRDSYVISTARCRELPQHRSTLDFAAVLSQTYEDSFPGFIYTPCRQQVDSIVYIRFILVLHLWYFVEDRYGPLPAGLRASPDRGPCVYQGWIRDSSSISRITRSVTLTSLRRSFSEPSHDRRFRRGLDTRFPF